MYVGPWQELQLARMREEAMRQLSARMLAEGPDGAGEERAWSAGEAAVAAALPGPPRRRTSSAVPLSARSVLSPASAASSGAASPAASTRSESDAQLLTGRGALRDPLAAAGATAPEHVLQRLRRASELTSRQPTGAARRLRRRESLRAARLERRRSDAVQRVDAMRSTFQQAWTVGAAELEAQERRPPKVAPHHPWRAPPPPLSPLAPGSPAGAPVGPDAPASPTARRLQQVSRSFEAGLISPAQKDAAKEAVIAGSIAEAAAAAVAASVAAEDAADDSFDEADVDDLLEWTKTLGM